MTIALGTTSGQKLASLREVLDDIGVKANIISVDVKSGISNQPTTENEVLEGSVKRANNALFKVKNADIGLGSEVGYHKDKSGAYEMFCCTSIVDKNNFTQSCYSSRFPLPKYHQNLLIENKYLSEYVDTFKPKASDPISNYIRELIKSRKPLLIEATRNTLLTYLDKLNS
jgi:non-canonical (house-cleaning) NTP pyrophosphatase